MSLDSFIQRVTSHAHLTFYPLNHSCNVSLDALTLVSHDFSIQRVTQLMHSYVSQRVARLRTGLYTNKGAMGSCPRHADTKLRRSAKRASVRTRQFASPSDLSFLSSESRLRYSPNLFLQVLKKMACFWKITVKMIRVQNSDQSNFIFSKWSK